MLVYFLCFIKKIWNEHIAFFSFLLRKLFSVMIPWVLFDLIFCIFMFATVLLVMPFTVQDLCPLNILRMPKDSDELFPSLVVSFFFNPLNCTVQIGPILSMILLGWPSSKLMSSVHVPHPRWRQWLLDCWKSVNLVLD